MPATRFGNRSRQGGRLALAVLAPLALSLLGSLAGSGAQAQPAFQDVRAAFVSSETIVTDRHGEPIHRLRTNRHVRRGEWVPLARMSAALRQALVLSEDKRFYEHSGVDWRAVSAAAWANLWNTRTRGASTLTMQLTGLLDEDLRPGAGRRTLAQKFGQALAAEQLERRWQKHEILEAYLNLVPFRGELVGVDALSRTLFGKAPHGLNEAEAALAAALLRAPNAPRARVAGRACGVLRLMRPGADCLALDMLAQAALTRRAWAPSEGIAPHLARRLAASAAASAPAAQTGPATLPTTLDAATQRVALHSLRQQLRELRGRQVEDGAALVLDNASGEVLAWVGSSGHGLSRAAEVDGVTAPRQPGSTLKPFLYAQAIAERRLTAASLLEDSPAHLPTASGLYIPQNYDRRFKGWVSVRTALAASLNIPAVRALVMVSPEAFHRQLGRLGMPLPEGSGYYGYSLALGSAEVTLLQLANAYRALANGGRLCSVRWQPAADRHARPGHADGAHGTGCTAALDAGAAFIVGDILADRHARALTFGTDSVLATRFWSAVKTGTSKDMRDNWAVGYSRRYTVAVWVGNASGQPMHGVSGTSGAAPVWAALMRHLHAATPSRPPAPPPGLAPMAVRFGDGLEAARDEWFLPGTGQAVFAIDSGAFQAVDTARNAKNAPNIQGTAQAAHSRPGEARAAASAPAARIRAPADGSILALDPDIPPRHQRLRLSAQVTGTPAPALRWRIGGREVGRGPHAAWLPWPGRHTVQLLDAQGRVLDEVRLQVRGAGVKPGAAPHTTAPPPPSRP
ncbi:penicillin-binding protein 1C [Comamonadaceae bacterium OH2545_COT-014]|nr:penicillin-binding protein 1C [Comamonadaceae bacterium OH2545_COT-014]